MLLLKLLFFASLQFAVGVTFLVRSAHPPSLIDYYDPINLIRVLTLVPEIAQGLGFRIAYPRPPEAGTQERQGGCACFGAAGDGATKWPCPLCRARRRQGPGAAAQAHPRRAVSKLAASRLRGGCNPKLVANLNANTHGPID